MLFQGNVISNRFVMRSRQNVFFFTGKLSSTTLLFSLILKESIDLGFVAILQMSRPASAF